MTRVGAVRPKGLGGFWARRFLPKTRRIAARRESPLLGNRQTETESAAYT